MIIAHLRRARTLASTFVGLLAVAGCSKASGTGVQQQGQAAPPPAQVGIVTVSPATIAEPYELGAQVQPYRRVEVRSRVEGIIVERPFTEGSGRLERAGALQARPDQIRRGVSKRGRAARQREAHGRATRAAHSEARRRAAGRRQRALGARVGASRGRRGEEGSRRLRDSRRDQRAGRSRAAGARRARDRSGRPAHDDRRARSGLRDVPSVVAAVGDVGTRSARRRADSSRQQPRGARGAARRLAAAAHRPTRLRRAVARLGERHAGVPREVRERRSPTASRAVRARAPRGLHAHPARSPFRSAR